MSYQVLARKWRPQNFKQMVGQEHVLQALINALDNQRLHHAYLFTGTRGVGKTTIGRILAKCLSCQEKITSEPCGQCAACLSIAEGRYVDLIEIDAASRTKVEDMRELLENVQYAPTQGRFKIYLIDEVHMLSQSSFNALLKTLEEPPAHVKFLFATTDPQKLPVTILSRCLQFNLKNMSPEKIVSHLKYVLSEEQVVFEEGALWALARAADGSMRDALSLTDQAIAYANQRLSESGVSTMLGTVDQKKIYRILDALIRRDAAAMLKEVQQLADFSPDYRSVLASLAAILHRIALEQIVPGSVDNAMGDRAQIQAYAKNLSAEDVQLFYQIALTSRQDLHITPDAKSGFEMALLRMLAFQLVPVDQDELEQLPESEADNPASDDQPEDVIGAYADHETDSELEDQNPTVADHEKKKIDTLESTSEVSAEAYPEEYIDQAGMEPVLGSVEIDAQAEDVESEPGFMQEPEDYTAATADSAIKPSDDWNEQVNTLGLSGMTLNFMLNSVAVFNSSLIDVYVETGHFRLLNENHEKRIKEALFSVFPDSTHVNFNDGLLPGHETPMMWRERMLLERKERAKQLMLNDPNVEFLLSAFQANLIESSIQPEMIKVTENE